MIIIDEINEKVKNELSPLYRNFDVHIIEFKTFIRENSKCLDDHVHLTESILETNNKKFEIEISKSMINYHCLRISKEYREYFPKPGERFIIETDIGEIETNLAKDDAFSRNMKKWFEAHPELKVGDYVIIEEIEPKKRYRLYIKKSGDKNESY